MDFAIDEAKKKRISELYSLKQVEKLINFREDEPFDILGPRVVSEERCVVVSAFLPHAQEAWIRLDSSPSQTRAMDRLHPNGFFQAVIPDTLEIPSYKIGTRDASGFVAEFRDPYAFKTEISEYDLYLIGEGNHFESYDKFGAHIREFSGATGVHFAVWAPNAESVAVIGNFNRWHAGAHPMTRIRYSSVWGLFIPNLKEGEVYKFAIRAGDGGQVSEKSDPYALAAELRPHTASVVAALDRYAWSDGDWVKRRSESDPLHSPLSIYELHLGSWAREKKPDGSWGFLDYKELAHRIVDHVKAANYTHVELLPIMEHPLDESWGYQVVNYYAPTSRFGKPEGFMYFVDYCHKNGIGVILDWVPAHFPKDMHGLNLFDGRQIYAYEHWKKGEHKDWGTLIFDYGKNEVRNFLISNALFWIDKYHIDGLRVDAVASMLYLDYSRKEGEWEPNVYGGRENLEAVGFIKKFNEVVHARYPGVLTIAEESTAWPGVSRPTYLGGLGFSMKWNMGWMHDTLQYFEKEPVYRKFHQGVLTFSLLYAFSENFVLPISHDEVVYGKKSLLEKMPGDEWQKFANLRLFLSYMYAHPGKKILFQGCDVAQREEWNSMSSVDWHLLESEPHRKLALFLADVNKLYGSERALYETDFDPTGFEWIDFRDTDASVLSFLRRTHDGSQTIVFTFNMTPMPREGYRIGVPHAGFYKEVLNSDAAEYGGSGVGNLGGILAETTPWHGLPHSILVKMPPLGAIAFRLG